MHALRSSIQWACLQLNANDFISRALGCDDWYSAWILGTFVVFSWRAGAAAWIFNFDSCSWKKTVGWPAWTPFRFKASIMFFVTSKFFLSSCRYALKVKLLQELVSLFEEGLPTNFQTKYAMNSQENTRGAYCWHKQTWWIRVPLVIIGSFWTVV